MAVKKKGRLGAKGTTTGSKDAKRDLNLMYSANQIWNAGLGALSRTQGGGTKFFEELVREGSKLQGGAIDAAQKAVMQAFQGAQKTVNRRVDGVRDQATETWDNLEKIFQTRVQRALHQLGMPTAEEITALTRKVEQLNSSVEKLAGKGARRAKPKAKAKTKGRNPAKRRAPRKTGG